MKNTKKGFTLIELLVVIAIIGILASVVLVNLNSARNKGSDAKIKSTLANVRSAAELIADGGSYGNVCTADSDVDDMLTGLEASTASVTACVDDTDGWAASASLIGTSGHFWCVDSTGASRETAAAATTKVCPAAV